MRLVAWLRPDSLGGAYSAPHSWIKGGREGEMGIGDWGNAKGPPLSHFGTFRIEGEREEWRGEERGGPKCEDCWMN